MSLRIISIPIRINRTNNINSALLEPIPDSTTAAKLVARDLYPAGVGATSNFSEFSISGPDDNWRNSSALSFVSTFSVPVFISVFKILSWLEASSTEYSADSTNSSAIISGAVVASLFSVGVSSFWSSGAFISTELCAVFESALEA